MLARLLKLGNGRITRIHPSQGVQSRLHQRVEDVGPAQETFLFYEQRNRRAFFQMCHAVAYLPDSIEPLVAMLTQYRQHFKRFQKPFLQEPRVSFLEASCSSFGGRYDMTHLPPHFSAASGPYELPWNRIAPVRIHEFYM